MRWHVLSTLFYYNLTESRSYLRWKLKWTNYKLGFAHGYLFDLQGQAIFKVVSELTGSMYSSTVISLKVLLCLVHLGNCNLHFKYCNYCTVEIAKDRDGGKLCYTEYSEYSLFLSSV